MRDIDDWMFHFERQAASRLRKLFSADVDELPKNIALRLEKLRDIDRASTPMGGRQEAQPGVKRRE
ncbi:MAG TPA: hypothetical protein PKE16_08220 [Hyphomicrobium sp.]|nr:hypothetical protein [Hyphomicrobium sp.]